MNELVFVLLISLAAACTPPRGYKPMTTEELVPRYPLIFLATLKQGESRSVTLVGGKKTYDVFCALKGDYRTIPAMITLEDPINACVSIPSDVGQSYILGLSRVDDATFTWWKEAGLETVVHDYTKENLDIFMNSCENQNPTPPDGQQNAAQGNRTCPVVSEYEPVPICSGTINLSVKYFFISLCAFFAYNFLKQ